MAIVDPFPGEKSTEVRSHGGVEGTEAELI